MVYYHIDIFENGNWIVKASGTYIEMLEKYNCFTKKGELATIVPNIN